ncbi:MAG: glutamate--tRNA ligase [Actinomycetota bacterium]|nr:glutamate--tRNA ligase [Actinomycetota bacterium]
MAGEVPTTGGGPRVRFAPSPTGYFHVGSARAALFNWLVARQSGGTFVLRIEDTDAERNREEWAEGIVSALHWLGMDADEGPYRQSARSARYAEAVDLLWSAGALYACDCTRDDIDARNRAAGIATPGYDGFCRARGLERVGPDGGGRALRFAMPHEGTTTVADVIRGDVVFPHGAMDDFVVVKSSGAPLFVLANVVDDVDMAITHVIRGEDLLPTTPRGILVWQALGAAGWVPERGGAYPGLPVFAHLPLLVNEQRKKLSKRRDPVAVEDYRDKGYLPEAFVNYLALLGWSPHDGREVFTVDELVEWFRLEDVNHAPAFFDVAKLTHMNGEYIRALPVGEFIERCRPWTSGGAGSPAGGAAPWPSRTTAPWPAGSFDEGAFARMAPLVQERVATLGEVPAMVDFLFLDEPVVDEGDWARVVGKDEGAAQILEAARAAYGALGAGLGDGTGSGAGFDPETLHRVTQELAESVGRTLAKTQGPIRVALTGRRVGPPLFESMAVLGRDRVLARLDAALRRLGVPPGT